MLSEGQQAIGLSPLQQTHARAWLHALEQPWPMVEALEPRGRWRHNPSQEAEDTEIDVPHWR
jgi:hypothetical protein